jgi:hypothetical protein
MEVVGYGAMGLGGLIAFIGWVWLIVVGFKEGGAVWGILIFFFSVIAGLIFCIMKKTGWIPLVLMIVGGVISGIGMVPVMMKIVENMPK